MKAATKLIVLLAAGTLGAWSAPASAQGTGRSMDFDLSIRSAGMGGASNAVVWGHGLDHWGNPALLGAERGVSYEWTRTQLVPELASDVILRTDVIKLAQGGAGVVISGRPFGAGVHLDYGESEGTDQSGNPTGMFASFEKVKSWGFGANLLETFESVTQLPGRSGNPLSRYFDVGFGMNFKHLDMFLGPGGGAGSTSALDWGTTVRVTPIDLVSRDGTPVRLDASFGLSVLSANDDALVVFLNEDQASPVSRHHRNGVALHLSADPAAGRSNERETWSWFQRGLSPLLAFTAASDRDRITAGSFGGGYNTSGEGAELAFANVASVRYGHYHDRLGDIDGATWGVGIGVPFGKIAGVRYDFARIPQASGLKSLSRHGASAWFDPVELVRASRSNRPKSL